MLAPRENVRESELIGFVGFAAVHFTALIIGRNGDFVAVRRVRVIRVLRLGAVQRAKANHYAQGRAVQPRVFAFEFVRRGGVRH